MGGYDEVESVSSHRYCASWGCEKIEEAKVVGEGEGKRE